MKSQLLLLSLLCTSAAIHAQQNGIEQSSDCITLTTGEHFLHWYGHSRRSYFVQVSDPNEPLVKWSWAPIIEGGNDEEISYQVGGTADKAFFRLLYTDQVPQPWETLETADFDGDGLSNLQEITIGSNPLNPDTDHDGFSDGDEVAAGTSPVDPTSFPVQVVASYPQNLALEGYATGQSASQPVILYLNQALPASVVSIPSSWLTHLPDDYSQDPGSGTTVILPGRRAVAFIPTGNSLIPWPEDGDDYYPPLYQISFNQATTGIPHLLALEGYFSTTTAAGSVDSGPWIGTTVPGQDYIDAPPDVVISAQWSEPLDPATIVPSNASLQDADGNPVAFTLAFDYTYGVNKLLITPDQPLAPAAIYTVTLGTGFTNLTGKAHLQPVSWSFTTRPIRPTPAGPGPFVTAVSPADFSFGIAPPTEMSITFSEAMDATTLTADNVHLQAGLGPDLAGTFTYDNSTRTLTILPATPFPSSTYFTLTFDSQNITNQPATGTPLTLQGNTNFVSSTGNAGTSSGGSGGTPNPHKELAFSLSYTWGELSEPDGDSGCTVDIEVGLPDGQTQMRHLAADTDKIQFRDGSLGPFIPDGSTIRITPRFSPGSDKDTAEELAENSVEVSQSSLWQCKTNYLVFRETTVTSGAITTEYLGKLSDGPFTAGFSDADDYQSEKPQTLILAPVNIKRKMDLVNENYENVNLWNYRILPGQQCNLKLDTSKIPQSLNPLSGLAWTFAGAESGRFSDYDMNDKHGTRTPVSEEDVAQSEISFYWAEQGIQATSVNCDLADGTHISLSVDMYVVKPNSVMNASITGQYEINPDSDTGGKLVELSGSGISPSGFSFFGNVSNLASTFGSEGTWEFVQLVHDGSYYTNLSGATFVGNHHNQWVLDTTCPYGIVNYTGVFYNNGDSPSIGLATDMLTVGTQDQWVLYQMFKPPGGNSKWVPLKSISWQGSFMASKTNGQWQIDSQSTYASSTSSDTFIHPEWTANFKTPIDPFHWVPQ